MASALQEARIHQSNQRRIDELKDEVLGLEARLRDIWYKLDQGKKELEEILEDGEERLAAIDRAKSAPIPYEDLLSYASIISGYTSAPPGLPDPSLGVFNPPFPTQEMLRRGRLKAEGSLGPLGETRSVGRARSEAPLLPGALPGAAGREVPLPNIPGQNPYRQDQHTRKLQEHFDPFDLDLNPDL